MAGQAFIALFVVGIMFALVIVWVLMWIDYLEKD